jgi:selenium metabolism protein YedF
MKTIDCRDQACPAPVIATKKALEESAEGICVLVDDGAPRENVRRFARNRGYRVTETAEGTIWRLSLDKKTIDGTVTPDPQSTLPATGDRVLLITSNILGEDSNGLGWLLMRNFLFTLLETDTVPQRILLLNRGVLLAVHGEETVEALKRLEDHGVEIFSCGICLEHFKKKEQLAVGLVTNMFSTAEQLLAAASVIKL